jgi:hypothetical protein
MALKVEGVVDGGMYAEEALGRSSRFEALHLALSSPHRTTIQMPSICSGEVGAALTAARSLVRTSTPSSGRSRPAPDGLVADVEAALGEEILDVSVAERETQVDPHGMLDDNRRKAVTTVGEPTIRSAYSYLSLRPCDYPDKAERHSPSIEDDPGRSIPAIACRP